MKTQQLTLLSFFFEDFRTIDKIFKNRKENITSIDFDISEKFGNSIKNYPHLTDVDTFQNTAIRTIEVTPEGDEIRRQYKIKNFSWSKKPSIKNDLDLVYMGKTRAEDKE